MYSLCFVECMETLKCFIKMWCEWFSFSIETVTWGFGASLSMIQSRIVILCFFVIIIWIKANLRYIMTINLTAWNSYCWTKSNGHCAVSCMRPVKVKAKDNGPVHWLNGENWILSQLLFHTPHEVDFKYQSCCYPQGIDIYCKRISKPWNYVEPLQLALGIWLILLGSYWT